MKDLIAVVFSAVLLAVSIYVGWWVIPTIAP